MDVLQTLLATGTGTQGGGVSNGAVANTDMLLASTAASTGASSGGLFAQVLSLMQQGAEAGNPLASLSALAGEMIPSKKKNETGADTTMLDMVNPAMAGLILPLPVIQPVVPVNTGSDGVTDNMVIGDGTSKAIITMNQVIAQLSLAEMAGATSTAGMEMVAAAGNAFANAVEAEMPLTPANTNTLIQQMAEDAAQQAALGKVSTPSVPDNANAALLVSGATNAPASENADKLKELLVKPEGAVAVAPQDSNAVVPDVIAAKAGQPVQKDVVDNLAKNPAITLAQASGKASGNNDATPAKTEAETTNVTKGEPSKADKVEELQTADNKTPDDRNSSHFSDHLQKAQHVQKHDTVKKPEFSAYQAAVLTPPPTEQVTISISKALRDGDGNISIQLKPMELGHVDIRMEFSADGKASIHIVAEKQDTLNLLQKDSQSLEKSLSDAGLKADSSSLNFSLKDGSTSQQGKRESQQQPSSHAYPTQQGGDNAELQSTKLYTGYINNNGIDIRV